MGYYDTAGKRRVRVEMTEDGDVVIDLSTFIDNLPDDARDRIGRSFAFEERIFGAVLELVTDPLGRVWQGFAEETWLGMGWSFGRDRTRELRQKLADVAPEAIRNLIDDMKELVEMERAKRRRAEEHVKRLEAWLRSVRSEQRRSLRELHPHDVRPLGLRPDYMHRSDLEDDERIDVDAVLERLEAAGIPFDFSFPETEDDDG